MPFENINFGLLRPTTPLENPGEIMAKVLQLKNMQTQGQLGQMQLQKEQQGLQDAATFRDKYGVSPGVAQAAQKMQLGNLENVKAQHEAAKAELEAMNTFKNQQWQTYSKATPENWPQVKAEAAANAQAFAQKMGRPLPPGAGSSDEDVFDPAKQKQRLAGLLTFDQQLKQAELNLKQSAAKSELGKFAVDMGSTINDPKVQQAWLKLHPKQSMSLSMNGAAGMTPEDKAASVQAAAQALVEGRGKWPSGRELADPILGQAINVARKMDPTLNQGTFALRQNAQKEADTGKIGQSNNAIKTVLGHAGHLVDAYAELPDEGMGKGVNWLVGKGKELLPGGNPGLQKVYDLQEAIGPEMAKAYIPGQGTEGERTAWKERINPFRPDPERKASMNTFAEMLITKLNANEAQYRKSFRGLSDNAVPAPMQLDEDSYNALKKIEAYTGKPIKGAAKWMQRYEQSENPQSNTPAYSMPNQIPASQPQTSLRVSPEEAKKLPSGTRFIGLDGVERVKH